MFHARLPTLVIHQDHFVACVWLGDSPTTAQCHTTESNHAGPSITLLDTLQKFPDHDYYQPGKHEHREAAAGDRAKRRTIVHSLHWRLGCIENSSGKSGGANYNS